MLLLFSIVGWRIWRKPPAATTSATQPAVAPPAQSAAPAETTEILSVVVPASKPTPAHSRTESGGIPLVIASKTEGAPDKISPTETLNAGEHPSPPLARSSTNASQIASLLSTPARLPEFAAPISQGFSGGTLIRKVQPAYPRQAVPLGLKGSVRLQATVAENGTVRDLKVTSGHPVLARAAVEAVSQWRYRPFLLNGKPIRKQVDISIDFNMPESAK
jgi:protein TonB